MNNVIVPIIMNSSNHASLGPSLWFCFMMIMMIPYFQWMKKDIHTAVTKIVLIGFISLPFFATITAIDFNQIIQNAFVFFSKITFGEMIYFYIIVAAILLMFGAFYGKNKEKN